MIKPSTIVNLSVPYVVALMALLGPLTAASARPKVLGTKIYCNCWCHVSDKLKDQVVADDRGYSCTAFNGKVCNLSDPETGLVSSGRTSACFASDKYGIPTRQSGGDTPPTMPTKPKPGTTPTLPAGTQGNP